MGRNAKDVIANVSKDKQIRGMTKEEIQTELLMAGYGVKKIAKRTNELIVSAQLQSDLTHDEHGKILFWSPMWPWAWKSPIGKKLDATLICAVYYDEIRDPRHNYPLRADGRKDAWILE
jgi:hypothetical protein